MSQTRTPAYRLRIAIMKQLPPNSTERASISEFQKTPQCDMIIFTCAPPPSAARPRDPTRRPSAAMARTSRARSAQAAVVIQRAWLRWVRREGDPSSSCTASPSPRLFKGLAHAYLVGGTTTVVAAPRTLQNVPATLIEIDSGNGLDNGPAAPAADAVPPRTSTIIAHKGFKRETLRDMSFDQMFALVQDLNLSQNVKGFLQRLHWLCARRHGISPHDSFVPLKNDGEIIVRRIMRVKVRVIMAAYIIAFHPARVFGERRLHIHAPLMEAATHLLISLENIASAALVSGAFGRISPSLTESFNSILFRYFAYFEIWKNPDQNLCLSELQCDLLDLYRHRVACIRADYGTDYLDCSGDDDATQARKRQRIDTIDEGIDSTRNRIRTMGGMRALEAFDAAYVCSKMCRMCRFRATLSDVAGLPYFQVRANAPNDSKKCRRCKRQNEDLPRLESAPSSWRKSLLQSAATHPQQDGIVIVMTDIFLPAMEFLARAMYGGHQLAGLAPPGNPLFFYRYANSIQQLVHEVMLDSHFQVDASSCLPRIATQSFLVAQPPPPGGRHEPTEGEDDDLSRLFIMPHAQLEEIEGKRDEMSAFWHALRADMEEALPSPLPSSFLLSPPPPGDASCMGDDAQGADAQCYLHFPCPDGTERFLIVIQEIRDGLILMIRSEHETDQRMLNRFMFHDPRASNATVDGTTQPASPSCSYFSSHPFPSVQPTVSYMPPGRGENRPVNIITALSGMFKDPSSPYPKKHKVGDAKAEGADHHGRAHPQDNIADTLIRTLTDELDIDAMEAWSQKGQFGPPMMAEVLLYCGTILLRAQSIRALPQALGPFHTLHRFTRDESPVQADIAADAFAKDMERQWLRTHAPNLRSVLIATDEPWSDEARRTSIRQQMITLIRALEHVQKMLHAAFIYQANSHIRRGVQFATAHGVEYEQKKFAMQMHEKVINTTRTKEWLRCAIHQFFAGTRHNHPSLRHLHHTMLVNRNDTAYSYGGKHAPSFMLPHSDDDPEDYQRALRHPAEHRKDDDIRMDKLYTLLHATAMVSTVVDIPRDPKHSEYINIPRIVSEWDTCPEPLLMDINLLFQLRASIEWIIEAMAIASCAADVLTQSIFFAAQAHDAEELGAPTFALLHKTRAMLLDFAHALTESAPSPSCLDHKKKHTDKLLETAMPLLRRCMIKHDLFRDMIRPLAAPGTAQPVNELSIHAFMQNLEQAIRMSLGPSLDEEDATFGEVPMVGHICYGHMKENMLMVIYQCYVLPYHRPSSSASTHDSVRVCLKKKIRQYLLLQMAKGYIDQRPEDFSGVCCAFMPLIRQISSKLERVVLINRKIYMPSYIPWMREFAIWEVTPKN